VATRLEQDASVARDVPERRAGVEAYVTGAEILCDGGYSLTGQPFADE